MLSENGTLVSSIVRMGVNGSEMSGREWTRHWQDGLPAGLERGGKQMPQVIILRFLEAPDGAAPGKSLGTG